MKPVCGHYECWYFFHSVWILIFPSMQSQPGFSRARGLKLNISCSLCLKPVFGLSPDLFDRSGLKLDFSGPHGLNANFVHQHGLKPIFFNPTGLNPALFGSNVRESNIAGSHGLKPDNIRIQSGCFCSSAIFSAFLWSAQSESGFFRSTWTETG